MPNFRVYYDLADFIDVVADSLDEATTEAAEQLNAVWQDTFNIKITNVDILLESER